jgi:glycerol-3-phosphate dehydrogenase
VLALAAEGGPASPELAQPIVPGLPDILAEAVLAARHEQARSIGDVLLRRTRLGLLAARELTPGLQAEGTATDADADAGPVQRVGAALARELQWSHERLGLEIERFAQESRAEGLLTSTSAVARVDPVGSVPPAPMT